MCKSNVWRSNGVRLFRGRIGEGKGVTWPANKIDSCITHLINALNGHPHIVTLASCCGHGVYPLTVIVKDLEGGRIYELLTNRTIKGRSKKFYKADPSGRYYVPEVSTPK